MTDAEKKWEDHCKRVFYLGPPEERIVAMAILKDFKQALREAIEKENMASKNNSKFLTEKIWTTEEVLTLIDEVEPPKTPK